MNIGFIQAGGNIQQPVVKAGAAGASGKGTFGSMLSTINAQKKATSISSEGSKLGESSGETLTALFNATTVEELEAVLKELESLIPGLKILEEGQVGDFQQIDVSKLLENMELLLKQAGLSDSELLAAATANDVWSLLNLLDEIAPKFFEGMLQVLEGKGDIPKNQAIELLVFLKTVTVQAAGTDLTMKQEQQLFSLQGFLQVAGERFESILQTQYANRNNLLPFMESQHQIRLEVQSEANGQMKEESKEMFNQSTMNISTTTRGEALPAELENKQNVRSETLIREMQAILKRANFGQAGGANRISIQLYPEHLGQVRIELLQVNGVMTARILASTALGKEMLDSQLHQLRHGFAQQNLQVDRIDISQALQDAPRNERDNAFNQHFRQNQEELEEHEDQNAEEQMTFQEYMIELEA